MRTAIGAYRVLALAAGAVVLTGGAAAQSEPWVAVSFSPAQDEFTLGEPVIVKLTLQNGLSEGVVTDLGVSFRTNLRSRLVGPDGQVKTPPRTAGSIFGPLGKVSLAPQGQFSEQILLNRWYTFDGIGGYDVDLNSVAPITTESGVPLPYQVQGHVVIEVVPRDPARLEQLCSALDREATEASTAAVALDAGEILSYVADPIAVPHLAHLAQASVVLGFQAIPGLERIGNEPAADALISILSNSRDDMTRASVRGALTRLQAKTSDAMVRQKIADAIR